MNMHSMNGVGTLALMAVLLARSSPGQEPCPDVRASQVDGKVQWVGEVVRCGIGFRIFGLGGGIFGPRCPEEKHHIPAHQVCQGEPNDGTRCVPAGTLEIEKDECECSSATILGTGLLFPSCNCAESGLSAGTVEDFATERCEGAIEA